LPMQQVRAACASQEQGMSRKIGDKIYLSPSEVAERMGVSLRTVQRWIARGGVISSPWMDFSTGRRRTWHQTRVRREAAEESPGMARRGLCSDIRAEYRPVRPSALRQSLSIAFGEQPYELRLSFITDPSSGFHYFPEDEVMAHIKRLTEEGGDRWRVRAALEAEERREARAALREPAAAESGETEPTAGGAADAGDKADLDEKPKQSRKPDSPR